MFNIAERWGQHQGTNPVRLVKFLPENNYRFQTLSEDEERRLLLASPPYLREMILLRLTPAFARTRFSILHRGHR
jgi:hypothetical protein